MKNFYKYLVALFFISIIIFPQHDVLGGNKDRTGQAGADELLINPWTRNSGWGGANVANVGGLEGIFNNVAGIAHTNKTEVVFSYTDWLRGADIKLMAFGISQKIGESGAIGLSIVSMNFGDIEIRTIDQPEGNIGTFSPRYLNINIAYAKAFSNSIFGGLNVKIINESIANASATGFAIDAGIQYVTGEKENIKFGISLRNVGPKMKFSGDGYSLQTFVPNNDNQFTTTQRAASFELPTQLNIGASYDFLWEDFRYTLAGDFISNSFKKDQFALGMEFAFKNYLMLRAGYAYEQGMIGRKDPSDPWIYVWNWNFPDASDPERTNFDRGVSLGVSVQVPLKKGSTSVMAIDYSMRPAMKGDNFSTINSFGIRFTL